MTASLSPPPWPIPPSWQVTLPSREPAAEPSPSHELRCGTVSDHATTVEVMAMALSPDPAFPLLVTGGTRGAVRV